MKMIIAIAGLLAATSGYSQQFSIAKSKIASGGGTSGNGPYVVTGTIAQPDAGGVMSGGPFAIDGGFWSLPVAVQMPGAPLLTITFSNNIVKVSWPYDSTTTGYSLQQSSNLAGGNWVPTTYSVGATETTKNIMITAPTGNLFFRLIK